MFNRHRQPVQASNRRGSLSPAIAIAVLAVGGCIALVLDNLWLQTAHREIQTAVNAAALAAAGHLANDELLKTNVDMEKRASQIRRTASQMGAFNRAAGNKIFINSEAYEDVRLGRVVIDPNTGWKEFLETDHAPTAVIVKGACDRKHGNPVSLFFPFLTGTANANVVALAEASVNNDVVGVRPLDTATTPAWPLGVQESSLDPKQQNTWTNMIELRIGKDEYRWDNAAGKVVKGSDGLPEMTLIPTVDDDNPGNYCLLDIGTGLKDNALNRQIQDGWNWHDLQGFGSEFSLEPGPLTLSGSTNFSGSPTTALMGQVGQAKILVLFQGTLDDSKSQLQSVTATRIVAGRIMHVEEGSNGTEVILQPAVVTTRTALLRSTIGSKLDANKYVYKLSLTH